MHASDLSLAYEWMTPLLADRTRARDCIICHPGDLRVRRGVININAAGSGSGSPIDLFEFDVARPNVPVVRTLAQLETPSGAFPIVWEGDDHRVHIGFDWFGWEKHILTEGYIEVGQPSYSALPIPYTAIPFGLRAKINKLRRYLLAYKNRKTIYPASEPDLTLDRLRETIWQAAASQAGIQVHKLSAREKFLVLTHDIDEGFAVAGIEPIRAIERQFAARSAWGVVSKRYSIDEKVLESLLEEGCELFSHDYMHDGRLAYLDSADIQDKLKYIFERYPRFREQIRGFRSGQLVRTESLYDNVAKLFSYDMTPPNIELGGPHGWRTGCGSVIPFRRPNGLLHLPLTLPQDYFMAFVDSYSIGEIQDTWIRALHQVWSAGGVGVLIVHPDNVLRKPMLLQAYRGFLSEALRAGGRIVTPWEALAPEIAQAS